MAIELRVLSTTIDPQLLMQTDLQQGRQVHQQDRLLHQLGPQVRLLDLHLQQQVLQIRQQDQQLASLVRQTMFLDRQLLLVHSIEEELVIKAVEVTLVAEVEAVEFPAGQREAVAVECVGVEDKLKNQYNI
jgi:hypothetical protein